MTTQPEWHKPQPLHDVLPTCPQHVLPSGVLAECVAAVSQQFQVPADLPLAVASTVLSAATRGRVSVQVNAGWVEPVALYWLPLLPSGSRKTQTLKWLAQPLIDAERNAVETLKAAHLAGMSELRIAQKRLERAEHEAGKDLSPEARAEVDAAQLALAAVKVPALPRYMLDDATPEALAQVVCEQGSVAVITAEGGVLSNWSGKRYGDGTANIDAVLKSYDAEPLRVDRRSSTPLFAERPHLSVCIAAQPDVLREARTSPEMRERGLLSRFLIVMPESNFGTRDLNPPAAPAHLTDAWAMTVHGMLQQIQPDTLLQLTADAHAALLRYRERIEYDELPAAIGNDWLCGTLSKSPGVVVRLAALFTLAAEPTARQIDADAMNAALGLMPWLLAHTRAAIELRQPTPAEAVLDWLHRQAQVAQRTGTPFTHFTTRNASHQLKQQKWVKGEGGTDRIRDALNILANMGWVQQGNAPLGKVGRPQEVWHVHPQLLQLYKAQRM